MKFQYNKDTKTITQSELEAKEKEQRVLVSIKGDALQKLIGFAQTDNITLTKKNKKGKVVQDDGKIREAIRAYVAGAVQELIEAREQVTS